MNTRTVMHSYYVDNVEYEVTAKVYSTGAVEVLRVECDGTTLDEEEISEELDLDDVKQRIEDSMLFSD